VTAAEAEARNGIQVEAEAAATLESSLSAAIVANDATEAERHNGHLRYPHNTLAASAGGGPALATALRARSRQAPKRCT
jgi:hypothetical protein